MNTNMEDITVQLKPTFERLSDDGLLSRCLDGKTQNQNESLNGINLGTVAKTNICRLGRTATWST